MFAPASKNILRWSTPDPESDYMMHGHLLISDDGLIMVDPPLIPGLLEASSRLGKLKAVILTTLDHTRGSRYISEKTGATLMVPDQDENQVDPASVMELKRFKKPEKYGEGNVLGLKAYRLAFQGDSTGRVPGMDEFALLTPGKELITGDIAVGTVDNRLSLAPEWYPLDPPLPPYQPVHKIFSEVVKKSGAVTLLASHGSNLYGILQELV